jgi:hypothetical protein
MTRVRVRIGGWYTGEFDLVNRTDEATYVVRDAGNNVRVLEQDQPEQIEVQCDLCGEWSQDVTSLAAGEAWACPDCAAGS